MFPFRDRLERHGLAVLVSSQFLLSTAFLASLTVAQMYAAYELNGSPLLLGVVAAVWGAPATMLAPVVGRAIDRFGPRRVGLPAIAVSAAACLGLCGQPGPVGLSCLLLFMGIGRAFATPAIDTMPAWLPTRPEQTKSGVWLNLGTYAPVAAGGAMAAATVSLWGAAAGFLASAATYVGSAVLLWLLGETRPEQTREPTESASVARFSLRDIPGVRAILGLSIAVWVSYGGFITLEVVYVSDVLHTSMETFALIQVVHGLGMLLASLVVLRLPRMTRSAWVLWSSAALIGVSETIYVSTGIVIVTFVGAFVWGIAAAMFGPACRIQLLDGAPPQAHGRLMAAWRSAQATGNLLPMPWVSPVAAVVGTQPLLLTIAVLMTATGSIGLVSKPLRARQSRQEAEAARTPIGSRG